jgi:NTE family protein
MSNVSRTAGASAGAITACLTSFNLPFQDLKKLIDTLDYRKIPMKDASPEMPEVPAAVQKELEKLFGDWECVLRLVKNYGWYSSRYFYTWIQAQIDAQFDHARKLPPYTFADFENPKLHVGGRPFFDLYIIGTDISFRTSRIYSFVTTPAMEVAEAVRISMSIPVFFESVKLEENGAVDICSDGGVMRNYPINVFDYNGRVNPFTLGARFKTAETYHKIDSLIDYIVNLFASFQRIQQVDYENSPQDIARSIDIDPGKVSFVDFDITPGDATYTSLYRAGYAAATSYFRNLKVMPYFGFGGMPVG